MLLLRIVLTMVLLPATALVGIGALVLPPHSTAALVVLAVLAGLSTRLALSQETSISAEARSFIASAVAGAVIGGTLLTAGTAAVFGAPVASGVPFLLLGSALWTLRRRQRRHTLSGSGSAPEIPGDDQRPDSPYSVPADPIALSTEELCRAWRSSYALVRQGDNPASLVSAAAARRAILDEMEKRNKDSFTRWMSEGARAANDPGPFFISGS